MKKKYRICSKDIGYTKASYLSMKKPLSKGSCVRFYGL